MLKRGLLRGLWARGVWVTISLAVGNCWVQASLEA